MRGEGSLPSPSTTTFTWSPSPSPSRAPHRIIFPPLLLRTHDTSSAFLDPTSEDIPPVHRFHSSSDLMVDPTVRIFFYRRRSSSRDVAQRRTEKELVEKEALRLQASLPSPEEILDTDSSETTVVLRPRRTIPDEPSLLALRREWEEVERLIAHPSSSSSHLAGNKAEAPDSKPEDAQSVSSQSESVVTVRAADSASNTISDVSEEEETACVQVAASTSLQLSQEPASAAASSRVPESISSRVEERVIMSSERLEEIREASSETSPESAPAPPPLPVGESAGIAVNLIREGSVQLKETLSLIEERLEGTEKEGKYGNFSEQEDSLGAVSENLEEVEKVVKGLRAQHELLMGPTPTQGSDLSLTLAALHSRVKASQESAAEKKRALAHRLSLWQAYHSELASLETFLAAEEKLVEADAPDDLTQLASSQKGLEERTAKEAPKVEALGRQAVEILKNMEGAEALLLRERLEGLSRRWAGLQTAIAGRRDMMEEKEGSEEHLMDEIGELEFWLDETTAILHTPQDPSRVQELKQTLEAVEARRAEFPERESKLKSLEKAKKAYLDLRTATTGAKQKVRQAMATTQSRMAKIHSELDKREADLALRLKTSSRFWDTIQSLEDFLTSAKTALAQYQSAIIYTPTSINPQVTRILRKALRAQLREKEDEIKDLEVDYQRLCDYAQKRYSFLDEEFLEFMEAETGLESSTEAGMWEGAKERFEAVKKEWSAVKDLAERVKEVDDSVSEDAQASTLKGATESQITSPSGTLESSGLKADDVGDEEELRMAEALDKSIPPDADPSEALKGSPAMNELRQLRHWLSDSGREAGGPVDLSSPSAVKEAMKVQAAFLDALQTKRLGLIRILEDSRESKVQTAAESLSMEWERAVAGAQKRKKDLGTLGKQVRTLDAIRAKLLLWLQDGESRTVDGPKVADCSEEELAIQLGTLGILNDQLDEQKTQLEELLRIGNAITDEYRRDDSSTLAQHLSDINTQWTKLVDNLRIRRAVVEAGLRSRQDLSTALEELEQWLRRMEIGLNRLDLDSENPSLLRDPEKRSDWIRKEKEIRAEIAAQSTVVSGLQEMGQKVAEGGEAAGDAAALTSRLASLSKRWVELGEVAGRVRHRLEGAQEAWERLTSELKELIYWVEARERALLAQLPVGGDLDKVKAQAVFAKALGKELGEKKAEMAEMKQKANSFLLQQDLKPVPGAVEEPEEKEKEARRIAQQIKVEAETLGAKWTELREKTERWEKIIEEALGKMYELSQAIKNCEAAVGDSETERRSWKPVKDLQLDQLPKAQAAAKGFRTHLLGLVRTRVDELNDRSSRLLAENIQPSPATVKTLDALNTRYKQVETALNARLTSLQNAMKDFGPASQHFLTKSVGGSWERAVSANRVPYYLDHSTEKTQWDHPKMVELVQRLCDYNEIKFAAYRTGMKLRALQKKLFLDLVPLEDLDRVFNRLGLGLSNASPQRLLDVSEMVMVLLALFEGVQEAYPTLLLSLPLAIDLCLNFILNVYDPSRSGAVRLLPFKLVLTLLSAAHLEEKYKYLFTIQTAGATSAGLDQKKLALLLYDAIQIPKFLGEAAAFGGSNVEPSVRSCFKRFKFPSAVTEAGYLEWMAEEPQSLVWLPVMHRISAAETSKHPAKCNICKMFPIVGLRYRSLRTFNFDICQNCFFSQRTAKGHKITDPMQEYCIPANSGEDVRDFSRVVRNKFRSKRSLSRSSKLGYLPVQSVEEGAPIEARNVSPENPETAHLHSRLELFSSRLALMEKSQSLSSPGNDAGEVETREEDVLAALSSSIHVQQQTASASAGDLSAPPLPHQASLPKSPAQLVHQMDAAQKEELDQIHRQLMEENQRLTAEYQRLKGLKAGSAEPQSRSVLSNGHSSLPRTARHHSTLPSSASLMGVPESMSSSLTEADLLAEAKALRQHKQRLEERSRVLEEHNSQLEVQLLRLKHLIQQHQLAPSTDRGSLEAGLPPSGESAGADPNGTLRSGTFTGLAGPTGTSDETDNSGPDQTGKRFGALMNSAADLGKAMESLVTAVTSDEEGSEPEDNK